MVRQKCSGIRRSYLGSGAQAIVNATLCGAVALFIAALISLTQLYKQRFASPKRV